jgi:hypothetical protein
MPAASRWIDPRTRSMPAASRWITTSMPVVDFSIRWIEIRPNFARFNQNSSKTTTKGSKNDYFDLKGSSSPLDLPFAEMSFLVKYVI